MLIKLYYNFFFFSLYEFLMYVIGNHFLQYFPSFYFTSTSSTSLFSQFFFLSLSVSDISFNDSFEKWNENYGGKASYLTIWGLMNSWKSVYCWRRKILPGLILLTNYGIYKSILKNARFSKQNVVWDFSKLDFSEVKKVT